MAKRKKMVGSPKGRTVGKPQKELTTREAKALGELGAFALHLAALLKERGWTHDDLAERCKAAKLDIKEYAIRAWLRGENMPKAHHLRPLASVLGLKDKRHILPE
jgi:ribosome-binding protein aMBF1 (putative translation factor)